MIERLHSRPPQVHQIQGLPSSPATGLSSNPNLQEVQQTAGFLSENAK